MRELTNSLPKTERFEKQFSNWGTDLYGALYTAARYIGQHEPYDVPKILWQHGCIPPWQQVAPEFVTYAAPIDWTMLVARTDEMGYLQRNGYRNVHSIGLPFIYTSRRLIDRRKDSLLVMPVHFLETDTGAAEGLVKYANDIANIRQHFGVVAVCVSPYDSSNGYWTGEFSKYGFPVVSGAASDDKNALNRIRTLMESFEYVTTNGWGSHCAYALYCGAKLSIWGTEYNIPKERMLLDPTWRANLAALDLYLSTETQAKEKVLKKFMRFPSDGVADEALGSWFLGENRKLSPTELRDVLGWSMRKRLTRFTRRGLSFIKRNMLSSIRKQRGLPRT